MKKYSLGTVVFAAVLGVSLSLAGVARQAEDPGTLLRAAIEKEEVDGDLQAAIALYMQVVTRHSAESAVAAKAQLRIGMCYEKLGNAEAVKAYEAVLSKFPREAEAVAEARSRLAALRKEEPAGLTVTRLLPSLSAYLECQAISPDGTKMAAIDFSAGQNTVVVDLAAGRLEPLTRYDWSEGSRWAWSPVWSPDGGKIAFLSTGWKDKASELWISSLDGSPAQLSKNPNGELAPCDWLPDGSAILAVLEGENKSSRLELISVKDGSLRQVCPLISAVSRTAELTLSQKSGSADVSPDGRFIVFSDGPADAGRNIYVVTVDGRSKEVLIDHPADEKEPRWAPDGRHIVFLSDRHGGWALWGLAVREGKPVGTPFLILENMQNTELASWIKRGLLARASVTMSEVNIVDIDPGTHAVLGKPRALELSPSKFYGGPVWSPDGRHLFFQSYSSTGEQMMIIMPSQGGQVLQIPFSDLPGIKGGSLQWLPDSSGLGSVYWDSAKRFYFGCLSATTGKWTSREIPSEGFGFPGFRSSAQSIAWSADAREFYYLREDGPQPVIVGRDLETGRERERIRLKPSRELGRTIKSSRDHRRLALDDDGDLLVADMESGRVDRLDFSENKKLFMPSWSPDGKHLVAKGYPEAGGDLWTELYVVSLPEGKLQCLGIQKYLHRGARIQSMPDWSPDGSKIVFDTRTFLNEASLLRNVVPENR